VSRSEREKGARGEREVAAIFRAHGFDCERTPNSGGLKIKGDLAGNIPAHVEVKRQEVARPWAWFAQACADAPSGALPLVAFRRNDSPWLALVDLERLAALLRAAELAAVMVEMEAEREGLTLS